MRNMLSPKEEIRLAEEGVAHVRLGTPWPPPAEMCRKYAHYYAIFTNDKTRWGKIGKALSYSCGPRPNSERLLAIGKKDIGHIHKRGILGKMEELVKNSIPNLSSKNLVFGAIANPDLIHLY